MIFVSCDEKDEIGTTIITGQVKDFFTNEPIKGIKLSVVYKESAFSSSSHEYVNAITDSEGNYYLEFEYNNDIEISNVVEVHSNYACSVPSDRPCQFDYEKGKSNTIDLDLLPISTLKLTLVNIPPISINDSINYILKNNLILQNNPVNQHVTGFDSISINHRIYGNDTTKILWRIYENGTVTKYSAEILINGIDTIEYKIKY